MNTMCLCEDFVPDPKMLVGKSEWVDIEFEVALDSGATDHVCHSGDVPGYVIEASPGSRAGQGFIVGNGARVPNDGQSLFILQYKRPAAIMGTLCRRCVKFQLCRDL